MPGPPPKGQKKEKEKAYMPATGHGGGAEEKEASILSKKKQEVDDGGILGSMANYKPQAAAFLESFYFDLGIGFVIALNSVFLGVEISLTLEGHSSVTLIVVESIFLVIYGLELGLRCFASGIREAFKHRWVQFDAFLLVLGIVCTWIIEPLADGSSASDALGPVMMLRTLRLLRLSRTVRIFRLLAKYREFWLLVRGFMKSLSLMACTVIMLVVSLYVFACLGVELITNHSSNETNQAFQQHVDRYFSSLPVTMMTLLRFAVLDNTSEVYEVLVKEDPWLFLYFGLLTVMVSLVSFNLIAAVIFQTTIEQGQLESDKIRKNQEDECADFFRDLKKIFLRLDRDGSGQLSLMEFQKIHPSDMKKLSKVLGMELAVDIFNALDLDGSGQISITEFFDGAFEMVLSGNVHKEVMHVKRTERQIELMNWKIKEMTNVLHDIDIRLNKVTTAFTEGSLRSAGRSWESLKEPAKGSPMGSALGSHLGSSMGMGSSSGVGAGSSTGALPGDWSSQLTGRLHKIWEEAVQYSMELTEQQIAEVGRLGVKGRKSVKKTNGAKMNGTGLRATPNSDSCSFGDSEASSECSNSSAHRPRKVQAETFTPRSVASAASSQVSQRAIV